MPKPKYDPRGPVFISYRHSDGMEIADQLTWLLHAAGIPVWHDDEGLTTGSIEARIKKAMAKGLSGGVLVVTPDAKNSKTIKKVEAPGLLRIHEENPDDFSLTVINAVSSGKQLDINEPDRVLGIRKDLFSKIKQLITGQPPRKDTLSGIMQFMAKKTTDRKTFEGLTESDKKEFITAYVKDHVAALNPGYTVELSIETRDDPPSDQRAVHDFDVFVRKPKKNEAISRRGLEDLQTVLEVIGDYIPAKKTSLTTEGHPKASLRVSGHAHLPIIFALGAQFPTTRNSYAKVDDDGIWSSSRNPAESDKFVTVADHGEDPMSSSNDVAVYVDLNNKKATPADPSNTENEDPFAKFRKDKQGQLRAWRHLRLVNPRDICAEDGDAIAKQTTDLILQLSEIHGKAHVHLFMQCPFALAFLIGRRTNTLTFTAYEFDKVARRYFPALEVHTTGQGGVIKEVLAPESTQQT